eukprot:jgi/Chrzof1/5112/Cz15g11250.t1
MPAKYVSCAFGTCCPKQPLRQVCSTSTRAATSRRMAYASSSNTCSSSSSSYHGTQCTRRELITGMPMFLALSAAASMAAPVAAVASPLQDITRLVLRPDTLTSQDAVVALLDARSILKEIAELAATPQDSEARFRARKMWPAYAKWLRQVGPSAPVVAALVAGGSDAEATLSSEYGGRSSGAGATDAVYISLGRVLTISGRTIKPEAQASPGPAQDAEKAIDTFLKQVPQDVLSKAQDIRKARAAAYS